MNEDDKIERLYADLNGHRRAGRDERARKTLEEIVALVPNEPVPRIALAEHVSLVGGRDEAVALANEAMKVAKSNGNFVRQATGVLIRAAKATGDYKLMEILIRELMDYSPSVNSVDIAPETDFLEGLPSEALSEALVMEYRNKFSRN